MPSAAWSLQKAVFAALAADAPLVALLGAARIYDDVPQASDFPYLTFGQSTARDWSTASDDGTEHTITLNIWSQAKAATRCTRSWPPPAPPCTASRSPSTATA